MAMLMLSPVGQIGQRLQQSMPPMIPSTPATSYQPSAVRPPLTQIKQGHGYTSTCVHDENIRLRVSCKLLEQQVLALKQVVFNAGLGSLAKEDPCLANMFPRNGRPVTNPKRKRAENEAAAGALIEMSKLIQGPLLLDNTVHFLHAVALLEPGLNTRLASEKFGVKKMEVADKRANTGNRTRDAPLISRANSFKWSAGSRVSRHAQDELRRLGGSALMDTPTSLQTGRARGRPGCRNTRQTTLDNH
jgi:hypothetical protein